MAAGVRAARVRQLPFTLTAAVVVLVGVSTLAFLLLRAQQNGSATWIATCATPRPRRKTYGEES